MTLISAKQISKNLGGYVNVPSVTTVGSSIDITSLLTTALTTAGYNGTSVTLKSSTSETLDGVITNTPNNIVFLFNATTKEKIYFNGNQVYGRITKLLSVYTISFYYFNINVETSYTFLANINLHYEIPYRFSLKNLSTDVILNTLTRFMPDNGSGGSIGSTLFKHVVIVNDDGVSYNQIYNAVSTANPGDLIWVQPGNYNEKLTINVDNLYFYFQPGAIVFKNFTGSSTPLFSSSNSDCNVFGFGQFSNDFNSVYSYNSGSAYNINFEALICSSRTSTIIIGTGHIANIYIKTDIYGNSGIQLGTIDSTYSCTIESRSQGINTVDFSINLTSDGNLVFIDVPLITNSGSSVYAVDIITLSTATKVELNVGSLTSSKALIFGDTIKSNYTVKGSIDGLIFLNAVNNVSFDGVISNCYFTTLDITSVTINSTLYVVSFYYTGTTGNIEVNGEVFYPQLTFSSNFIEVTVASISQSNQIVFNNTIHLSSSSSQQYIFQTDGIITLIFNGEVFIDQNNGSYTPYGTISSIVEVNNKFHNLVSGSTGYLFYFHLGTLKIKSGSHIANYSNALTASCLKVASSEGIGGTLIHDGGVLYTSNASNYCIIMGTTGPDTPGTLTVYNYNNYFTNNGVTPGFGYTYQEQISSGGSRIDDSNVI